MKILLIGGEGYIGNVIAHHFLQDKNNFITSLDNLVYENNECVLQKKIYENYNFVYGDMFEPDIIKIHAEASDVVVLLGGLVGDPITKKYPELSQLINEKAVKNVIDVCSGISLKNFIFISTCSNYGLMENSEYADENSKLNPLSLYAKAKVEAEKYILSLKGNSKMNPTVLRFATAFGLSPRMRFDLTISEFCRELALGNELSVYDAHTWRPYCHVKDFARLIDIIISSKNQDISFQVFNAGGDINNATKKNIVDKILKKIPHGVVNYQQHGNDPRNYRVNFNKVKSILGFEPKFSIEDGINELIDCFDENIFDLVSKNKNFYGNYDVKYQINDN